MKAILLAGALGLVASSAFAQDFDRDHYRHEHDWGPGHVIGHVLRGVEGREVYGGNCRIIVTHRIQPDGDRVTVRRRVCD